MHPFIINSVFNLYFYHLSVSVPKNSRIYISQHFFFLFHLLLFQCQFPSDELSFTWVTQDGAESSGSVHFDRTMGLRNGPSSPVKTFVSGVKKLRWDYYFLLILLQDKDIVVQAQYDPAICAKYPAVFDACSRLINILNTQAWVGLYQAVSVACEVNQCLCCKSQLIQFKTA